MKIVFLGTPAICLPTLQALCSNPLVELVHIVSMPDQRAGRGMQLHTPAVAQFAQDHHIPLLQTPKVNQEAAFLSQLKNTPIDLIIVFAFAQFLSQQVLSLPLRGCFNIHPSLLPKYRGAAPIPYALLNGDTQTGISVQKMVQKMDAGDIAVCLTVPITPTDNNSSLTQKLMQQAPCALNILLQNIANNDLTLTPQNEADVSFAPPLNKQAGHLCFTTATYQQLKNRIRALHPWPGTFCHLNQKRLKVLEIEPTPFPLPPGQCHIEQGFLLVGAQDQTIRLKKVQLAGKQPCLDYQLLNGFRSTTPIIT